MIPACERQKGDWILTYWSLSCCLTYTLSLHFKRLREFSVISCPKTVHLTLRFPKLAPRINPKPDSAPHSVLSERYQRSTSQNRGDSTKQIIFYEPEQNSNLEVRAPAVHAISC